MATVGPLRPLRIVLCGPRVTDVGSVRGALILASANWKGWKCVAASTVIGWPLYRCAPVRRAGAPRECRRCRRSCADAAARVRACAWPVAWAVGSDRRLLACGVLVQRLLSRYTIFCRSVLVYDRPLF